MDRARSVQALGQASSIGFCLRFNGRIRVGWPVDICLMMSICALFADDFSIDFSHLTPCPKLLGLQPPMRKTCIFICYWVFYVYMLYHVVRFGMVKTQIMKVDLGPKISQSLAWAGRKPFSDSDEVTKS